MAKQIEIIARGMCVVDKCLLLCRSVGGILTYLPGGHVEFNESASSALEREIMEELGVFSVAGEFMGAVEHTFIQKGVRHCEINLIFELTIESLVPDFPIQPAEPHLAFDWVPLDLLDSSTLEPAVLRTAIPQWLNGNRGQAWITSGDFIRLP